MEGLLSMGPTRSSFHNSASHCCIIYIVYVPPLVPNWFNTAWLAYCPLYSVHFPTDPSAFSTFNSYTIAVLSHFTLSQSHIIRQSYSNTVTLSHSNIIPQSHCHTITLSQYHTVTLLHSPNVTLSHYHTVTLSYSHIIPQSNSHKNTQSHCQTITTSQFHTLKLWFIMFGQATFKWELRLSIYFPAPRIHPNQPVPTESRCFRFCLSYSLKLQSKCAA